MIQVKPTHKLNGGNKATLCKVCRAIIDRGFTGHLLCPNCQETAIKLLKQVVLIPTNSSEFEEFLTNFIEKDYEDI